MGKDSRAASLDNTNQRKAAKVSLKQKRTKRTAIVSVVRHSSFYSKRSLITWGPGQAGTSFLFEIAGGLEGATLDAASRKLHPHLGPCLPGGMKMQKESLRELYIDGLRDLYNAETQLVRALPKMAKAAVSDQLRETLEEHLRQTSEHVSRLEQIFEQLEKKPSGKKCLGMAGLVKEGAETMGKDCAEGVMDAAIIGAAQRIEHYEIAGYGTVRAFADQLGENGHVSLLKQTLEEEKQTDKQLTDLSQEINPKAVQHEAGTSALSGEERSDSKSKKVA
jgi:ferritin-like metal-binding protein YciE